MSLVLILLTCAFFGGALVAVGFLNVWAALVLMWPVYKLCDIVCRYILHRDI